MTKRLWIETLPCAKCAVPFTSTRSNHIYCSRKCQPCHALGAGPGYHTTHGHTQNYKQTPAYRAWVGMIQRCTNPKFKQYADYGGRGIAVCERWLHSFESFYADMGERPMGMTLDRADNSRGYEPGNCKWSTRAEQAQNTRMTRLTPEIVREIRDRIANGERRSHLARRFGITRSRVSEIFYRQTWANV